VSQVKQDFSLDQQRFIEEINEMEHFINCGIHTSRGRMGL